MSPRFLNCQGLTSFSIKRNATPINSSSASVVRRVFISFSAEKFLSADAAVAGTIVIVVCGIKNISIHFSQFLNNESKHVAYVRNMRMNY